MKMSDFPEPSPDRKGPANWQSPLFRADNRLVMAVALVIMCFGHRRITCGPEGTSWSVVDVGVAYVAQDSLEEPLAGEREFRVRP